MSTDTAYNGWTNYETWNVGLWLSNDEGLYYETLRIVARSTDAAGAIEAFVREIRPNGFESKPYDLDAVNWAEVAESFEDETDDEND
jgi:hypothetical protein